MDSRSRPAGALQRDAIFRRALVGADALAGVVALAIASLATNTPGIRVGAVLVIPALVLVSKLLGLYDRDELVLHKATLDETPALLQLATLLTLTLWFVHDLILTGPVDRGTAALLGGSFLILVLLGRTSARLIARRLAPPERCVIIGGAGDRQRFANKLAQSRAGVCMVGCLPLVDERRAQAAPITGSRRQRSATLADLDEVVRELHVHRVVIIPGHADAETMLDAISRAKAAGVKVSILPRIFEVVGSSVEFDEFEGLTVLGVRRFGFARSSLAIKRAMDVVCSAAALLVVAPVSALIAVAIRLETPGPVLFRQTRVGRDGARFEMLKFRTMVDGAHLHRAALADLNECDGLFKLTSDPRVTRAGRLLRRTSLDELPQLWNVLRGDMSLVGPRPLILEEDERIEGRHRGRLQLTPGITGPWQLLGARRVSLHEMANMDYLYGANWSLWTDVKVLLRTVGHVLSHRNV